jgi:hypothetical protein
MLCCDDDTGYCYEPLRYEFVHHEHCRCHMRGQIYPGGLIAFYCVTHNRRLPSKAIAMRTCSDDRMIFNVRSPGDCGIQALKLPLTEHGAVEVHRLPAILGPRTQPIIFGLYPEFVGLAPIGCSICCGTRVPVSRLEPMFWAVDTASREIQLLMECLICHGQTVVRLDIDEDFEVGECRHNREPVHAPHAGGDLVPPPTLTA